MKNQDTPQYREGWKARSIRRPISDCPYIKGTDDARLWCHGWYDANRDDALLSEEMTEDYLASRY